MKTKTFHEPLYRAKVLLAIGTFEELEKYLWDKYKSGVNLHTNAAGGYFYLNEKDINCIWLENPELEDMAHECVHLVTDIFKNRNINIDLEKEDEHFAYYLTYWFTKFRKFMEDMK